MTEEEAKKKYCPLTRKIAVVPTYSPPVSTALWCLGSACMMWRPISPNQIGAFEYGTGKPIAPENLESQHGYCGLAGKP